MKSDHDSFLAFYLTQDDESALKFKDMRFGLAPYEVAEDQEVSLNPKHSLVSLPDFPQETIFHFVRDYETVKVEQEVPNEFLLVLNEDPPEENLDDLLNDVKPKVPRREKGAYYKNIERKMLLKKKRVNVSLLVLTFAQSLPRMFPGI